jgi:hypothetical protein
MIWIKGLFILAGIFVVMAFSIMAIEIRKTRNL